MASVTDICNLALGKLGADRVTNIDNPQSNNEQLCQLFYPIVRDLMLECRDWTFLTKRAVLSLPDLAPPAWGYSQAFTMPSDVYRVITIRRDAHDGQPSQFEWRKEDNKVVCNQQVIYMRYLSSDISTVNYSPTFVMAFATRLAYELCIQITEDRKLAEFLMQEAEGRLMDAAAIDGLQGKHEQIYASQLVNARQGGGTSRGNGGL